MKSSKLEIWSLGRGIKRRLRHSLDLARNLFPPERSTSPSIWRNFRTHMPMELGLAGCTWWMSGSCRLGVREGSLNYLELGLSTKKRNRERWAIFDRTQSENAYQMKGQDT